MPEMPIWPALPACRRRRLRGAGIAALVFVEQAHELHRLLVVDGRNQVGVAHVVNPRHVLVADALDAVLAEAELQQGRALQRFGGDDAMSGCWVRR